MREGFLKSWNREGNEALFDIQGEVIIKEKMMKAEQQYIELFTQCEE